MAMATRISTGMIVQATSISVLWVVFDGTGFALALNLTMTITSSASTNSVMTVISQNRKVWNQAMSSITGVTASCRPNFQGSGCAAQTALPARTTPANPMRPNKPIRLIDIFMPPTLPQSPKLAPGSCSGPAPADTPPEPENGLRTGRRIQPLKSHFNAYRNAPSAPFATGVCSLQRRAGGVVICLIFQPKIGSLA